MEKPRKEQKLKIWSPMESPISVMELFSYVQVNFPLEYIPLYQDKKKQVDTNIPLDLV